MFICEVNGTEINFDLKFSKYSKALRGIILVKADFYNIKKKKLQFAGTSFGNFLVLIFTDQECSDFQ